MTDKYADLKCRLAHLDGRRYRVELGFRRPQDPEETQAETGEASFDLDELRQHHTQPGEQGRILTESLFTDERLRAFLSQALAVAQSHSWGLRLRLWIDRSAADLDSLCWETLQNPEDGSFLAIDQNRPLSRYLEGGDWTPVQLHTRRQARALVVVANPADLAAEKWKPGDHTLAPVRVADELQRAREGLQGRGAAGRRDGQGIGHLDELASDPDDPGHVTLENLLTRLDRGYDVLYLACHGALRPRDPRDPKSEWEPVLYLEKPDGDATAVRGEALVERLRTMDASRRPALVVLASCQSAGGARTADREGALAALGPRLARVGIPAVLAMQGDVLMDTVARFMPTFFAHLVDHGRVDVAMAAARQQVRKCIDWWVPVLFTRLANGQLFQAAVRAPFMASEVPDGFVPRPAELDQLVNHLLDEEGAPRAVTVGLHGFGGYGKSTLARAICHDRRMRRAFPDGILWVTLGEKASEAVIVGRIKDLITTLTDSPSPDFAGLDAARTRLVEELGDRQVLLVVDDVWNAAHLSPFLEGGPRCARLVTTRDILTLPPDTLKVDVGAMEPAEAVAMLSAGLPPGGGTAVEKLAARLGEWPLLLKLVNGTLRHRIHTLKQALPDALTYVDRRLERRGMISFDAREPFTRDQAVAKTVGVSLELLTEDERARYSELAIFPKAVDIPLPTVEKLWGATGRLDELDTEDLCDRLLRLSLLLAYNPVRQTIRLHDVMVDYLQGAEQERLPALHERFLASYGPARWHNLPADEPYLWRYLAYHLVKAGRESDLRALLLDFDWLKAKLAATGVTALVADADRLPGDADVRLLGDALRLSAHVLAADKAQLWSQLYGRLMGEESPAIQGLLRKWPEEPWLRPLRRSLTEPGGLLLRTLAGHSDGVNAVVVYDGGRRAISASEDETLIVWNLETGQALRTLAGHSGGVGAVAVYDGGRRTVSASDDDTLIVWDLETGQALRTLEGNTHGGMALAVYDGGRRALSGSQYGTLIVWDLETGQALRTLEGHTYMVYAVVVYDGGRRAISASNDRTLIVWDLETGQALRTLRGHENSVSAVAVYDGGRRAISASSDRTLKVWDLSKASVETDQPLRTLHGHTSGVSAVVVYDGGKRAISASDDETLIVWDLEDGRALRTLEGHSSWISAVAVYDGGRRAISASNDKTLIVWDLSKAGVETAQALHSVQGHAHAVTAVAVYDGGRRAISASEDETLIVWDLEGGRALRTLEGHYDQVNAVVVYDGGRRAISASRDETLIVWDLKTGRALHTLEGHYDDVNAVAVYDGGRRALSASYDTLIVWDLETGQALRTLEAQTYSRFMAVAVYDGGRRGISALSHGTLIVWDLKTGQALQTLEGQYDVEVFAVVVYDGGQRAVSASADETLTVWDLEGGRALRTLHGHTDAVEAVAVYDGGQRAISASWDDTLIVWDLEGGRALRTLEGHSSRINAVAVYDGGGRAMSASNDKTLIVWDLEAGVPLHTFRGDASFRTCTVTPDSRTFVAGDEGGQVHILRLEGMDSPRSVPDSGDCQ